MEIVETEMYHSLIIDGIRAMKGVAVSRQCTAKQELNGVTVLVNPDSDVDLIFRDQQRAQSGYIEKEVGPYPCPTLTTDEIESDARIAAENEKRWAEQQAAYERQARIKADAVAAKLANAPALDISDDAAWKSWKDANQDSYGGGVITYAEQWGRLMQIGLNEGHSIADVAEDASREADTEGITGFMYGAAVSVLASCWRYGDELRRWHNLKYQLKDEGEKANESGGVLNPALLSIG